MLDSFCIYLIGLKNDGVRTRNEPNDVGTGHGPSAQRTFSLINATPMRVVAVELPLVHSLYIYI